MATPILRISLAEPQATVETVTVTCRGCRYVARLPIAGLIHRHGPDVWLAKRRIFLDDG
jgi:hypothetical protein